MQTSSRSSILSLSQSNDEVSLIWILRLCAAAVSSVAFIIVFYLAAEMWPAMRSMSMAQILSREGWNPSESHYNLSPMIVGSVLSAVLAICLAGPLGILSAVYSRFYAAPLSQRLFRALIELLAGIPSVVYGFWGLTVLVPLINSWRPPGASLLAGSLILALMIFPTVALIASACMGTVPPHQLRAAHALGLSSWGMMRSLVLPHCQGGLMAALVLASGRALGETMAILMVAGNVVQFPQSVFDPVRTLTANIALEMAYAVDTHRSALFLSGFVLILLVFLMIVTVELLQKKDDDAYSS